ncbi:MAG: AmmeMemoRadiSam system protein A [Thiotrichales bacterium]
MAHTSSHELTLEQQQRLLDLAEASIRSGLVAGKPCEVAEATLDDALRAPRATFVTLKHHGKLRGCIGTLSAHRSLARDVVAHAYAAAFSDPRFRPLRGEELAGLEVSIAILSPPEPLRFRDEADLLRQIRPGEDGLILESGSHRGTFLPSVWTQLPQRAEFLRQLKLKAGLPANHWSETLVIQRYRTDTIGPRRID